MKTGGYDLVVEMEEQLPNKLVQAYYYMGRFPKLKGTYVLPLKNVPPNLQPLTVIDYDVKLGLPKVDFIGNNSIRLSFSAKALLMVFGIRVEFDVGFNVDGSAFFDEPSSHLLLDLRNPEVTAQINDERVSQQALDVLNGILATVLRETLASKSPFVDLSPFVNYQLALPGIKQPFPLSFGGFKVTNDFLAAGVNALNNSGGNIATVENFTGGNDLAVGISEAAMNRFLDFWWDNAPIKKRIQENGEQQLAEVGVKEEIFIDAVINWFARGSGSWIAQLITAATKIERLVLAHEVVLDLGKPQFDLQRGNKIRVTGEVNFNFKIRLLLHYKVLGIVKLKLKWRKKTAQVASWTDDGTISYRGGAALSVDKLGNLAAKVTNLNLTIRGLPAFINVFGSVFATRVARATIEKYPPLMLGSIPVAGAISGTKLTLQLSPSLATTDEEAYIRAGVRIRGLENYPPPPYIANRNPKALEVHVPECEWLDKIAARHRVPYYWLEEAHADGYDNCFYCIGESLR